jgi:long-chain fatty acid transport protein
MARLVVFTSAGSKIIREFDSGRSILIRNGGGEKMATTGKKLITLAVAAALGGLASSAVAGGFAIGTQSGSGTGNAFAGGAAAADDASVAWYNPALMTLLPGKQVAAALHVLKPSFKYSDSGSSGIFGGQPVGPLAGQPAGNGGDGGDWAFVPNAFFTMAIDPKWSFGLALNVPFGLKTEYDAPWRGQLTAIKSEIKTVNINPSVAYKVSDTVSVGVGVSAQYIDAELTNCANTLCSVESKLTANDWGWGGNVGIFVQATPNLRIGAQYRSSIKYTLEGDVSFSGAGVVNNGDVKANLRVPESFSLSLFHNLSQHWELMLDTTWTGWSSVQQLNVIRTSSAASGAPGTAAGNTLTTLPFQWDDTWRHSVGANYKWSAQTKIRFGVAYDQTPTNDQFRTPRLPDQDRTWVAFGVQYKPTKTGTLDFGYAHEFIKDANVNVPVPGQASCVPVGCLTGKFDNKADIFSVQYSHSF